MLRLAAVCGAIFAASVAASGLDFVEVPPVTMEITSELNSVGLSETSSLTGFPQQPLQFVIVTDLDHASKESGGKKWHAVMKTGELSVDLSGNYSVRWLNETKLHTVLSVGNRGMELSEVIKYNGKLYAMCDKTGIVYEILPSNKAIQRFAVSDGNGEESKPYKFEWATVKDGELWMGSIGKEWVSDTGVVLHRNPEWIKIMDTTGHIRSVNWAHAYQALNLAANTTSPGYLWHEAVNWDESTRKWYFLPRKANPTVNNAVYNEAADETLGTNMLLIASEDFSSVEVTWVGPHEPHYGFSAIRQIPGTVDLFVVLKVKEVAGQTGTKLAVINSSSTLLSDWIEISDLKFEGLEFL